MADLTQLRPARRDARRFRRAAHLQLAPGVQSPLGRARGASGGAGARPRHPRKGPPPDHPDIAASANDLGRVLQSPGDLSAAQQLFERAVAMLEKTLPAEHPYLRGARAGLEDLLRRMA